MAKIDDLKTSLTELHSVVDNIVNTMDQRINDAVQAYKTKDQAEGDAEFDAAIGDIQGLTSRLRTTLGVVTETAVSISPSDLGGTTSRGPAAPEVQTTQTATTDPTGTAAAAATVHNVPDGAISTAAPAPRLIP